MAHATISDVRARWAGSKTLPDTDIVNALLEDAEMLIFAEVPAVMDKLTEDPDGHWHQRVVYVETQLVMQVLRNPDGVRQRAQTAGVFTDAVTYGSETIRSTMTITPPLRAILAGGGNKHVGIDMTPPTQAHPLQNAWVNGPTDFAPKGQP